ncbi:unnamed protein product [Ilex paraguariensis]|uniref:Secreted protein n=1 Tax=Ilex paraguariensis TaxID=185542 RepID=A0ABC8S9Y1_9AQUA
MFGTLGLPFEVCLPRFVLACWLPLCFLVPQLASENCASNRSWMPRNTHYICVSNPYSNVKLEFIHHSICIINHPLIPHHKNSNCCQVLLTEPSLKIFQKL